VRQWLRTTGFENITPMIQEKVGKAIFSFSFSVGAYTTKDMLYCPALEQFTFATKRPTKKKISKNDFDESRLQYQTRTNIVKVPMLERGYLDQKKQVLPKIITIPF